MAEIFDEILDYINRLGIIDTHEHLPCTEDVREKDTDVLKEYLSHYFSSDLISAGLSKEDYAKVLDTSIPLTERWRLLEPYWGFAKNTGYGRVLEISANELYGIGKIDKTTIEHLNESFLNSLKPGHFKKVLKEKSHIKIALLDDVNQTNVLNHNIKSDPDFFRNVCCIDSLIFPVDENSITQVETGAKIRICNFNDWLEACEIILDKAFESGVVALKSRLAYERTLKYERVPKNEAEISFNEIFKGSHFRFHKMVHFDKAYQDYLMHFILHFANQRNLTIQFHTGLQEGNGNLIYNSDPSLLGNLFLEYPEVDFDIFHMGYPYQHIVSALAKCFPNVYIDMCWAHIISPTASVNALIEWMDSVPINKISAFGGDYLFIDGVYGHQYIARRNVSKALAKKVEEGVFDIDEAKEVSEMLFYKNPLKIFKLEGKI